MEARVKWFNDEKGYGFLEYDDYNDIFVHYNALQQEELRLLSEGDIVEFNLVYTPNGYQAKDVILKTTNNLKNIITKDNIELVAAIVTIVSFVLSFAVDEEKQTSNQININCDNCKIQIIEQVNSDNDTIINIQDND